LIDRTLIHINLIHTVFEKGETDLQVQIIFIIFVLIIKAIDRSLMKLLNVIVIFGL